MKKLKASNISSFIKQQTGIDVEKYRDDYTRQLDKRSYINIETRNMNQNEFNTIVRLGNSYGGIFKIQPNGFSVYSITPVKQKT